MCVRVRETREREADDTEGGMNDRIDCVVDVFFIFYSVSVQYVLIV